MKAISIKQPWASLIAHGIKDVENRTWATKYRGTILIHSCAPTKFNIQLTDDQTKLAVPVLKTAFDGAMPFGAIIGKVDIIDCVINHDSIWAEKSYGVIKYKDGSVFVPHDVKPIYNWVLANPVLFDKPILNVKGKLSLWEFDEKEESC